MFDNRRAMGCGLSRPISTWAFGPFRPSRSSASSEAVRGDSQKRRKGCLCRARPPISPAFPPPNVPWSTWLFYTRN